MNIYLLDKVERLEIKFIKFSDGAEICEIPQLKTTNIKIVLNVENCNQDIIRLMLVKDALDNLRVKDVVLSLPYIPNARADRRFSNNQSHSLKVFCNIINSLGFKSVIVSDPHSDVSTALLDNVVVNDQANCFLILKPIIDRVATDYLICSPDLGATKKTFDLVMRLGDKELIQAIKIRDTTTGDIIKCDVQCDSLNGQDVVIVDDIADGGASFIYLSEKLRKKGAGKIILFVTHGIFSKGLAPLVGKVDYIFTYNLIEKFINSRDIELFNRKSGE
jgi:ribose-phosphate pyrophosphokinase